MNNTNSSEIQLTQGQVAIVDSWRYEELNQYKWQAKIGVNGKRVHLHCFDTPEEAAKAYDKAAKELHGDFAVLNFGI